MRLHGGGRLKKRGEEPGMRSDLAASSSPQQECGSGSDGHNNSSGECDSERNSDTPESYSAALLTSSSSSSSSVWHPHHLSDVEMSTNDGATVGTVPWRDVVLHSAMATDATPASSMAVGVPSKRKKAKKEVFFCHEPNCGKQFPRSFALRRHMRIHTGTKPYACDHAGCSQRFNTSGNLSRHKRIHSGERPYPCIFDTCGKKFNTSTKLKRHMRIHFPEGQNVFRCIGLDCGWSCGNYKEFAAHQKLQHNIIVGAGLEAVSAAAAAAAASGHHTHVADDDCHYEDRSPTDYDPCPEQGYDDDASSSSTAYLYNYGKLQHSLAVPPPPPPLPSVPSSQARKLTGNRSNTQYYDNGFNTLSGPSRETTKKAQSYDTEHLYSDHHLRRGKSTTTTSYALPPSFPSSDTATRYVPRTMALSSIYDSNATLAISSEVPLFGHQHAQSSSHRAGVLSGHSLRHEEETPTFKHEHESSNNQYEHESRLYSHQPHPHASPAHHHILRPPPPPPPSQSHHGHHGHHDHHDTMKFPVPPPMNPVTAEFTGEELSVVFELMKDSYY